MSVLYGTSQGSSVSDTAPNDVKIDRCSWCLCPTAHTRVTQAGFWLARAVHRCGGCARRTLPCRKTGCEAFARGHPDGVDDEFCVVHASAFPRWPDATPGASSLDARYAAEVRELMEPKGRCSWCLDNKRHFLKQWRNDGNHSYAAEVRDITEPKGRCSWCLDNKRHFLMRWRNDSAKPSFVCFGCARPTKRCGRAACSSFAKAADETCAACLGLVFDWKSVVANNESARKTGWCSWCGERCGHLVRRLKSAAQSETCECSVCGGGTAQCATCPGVMRAVSFHSSTCVRCDVVSVIPTAEEADATWEAFVTRRSAADVASLHPLMTLARDSRFKQAAHERGLWRPFAFLTTLPPRERVTVGARLGINLARQEGYLDPYAEAWHILTTPRVGMCARAVCSVKKSDARNETFEKVIDWGVGIVERFAKATLAPETRRDFSTRPVSANWLEILDATLTSGISHGACPALDPKDATALPKLATRRHGFENCKTPMSTFVATFEEQMFAHVTACRRAGLSVAHQFLLTSFAVIKNRKSFWNDSVASSRTRNKRPSPRSPQRSRRRLLRKRLGGYAMTKKHVRDAPQKCSSACWRVMFLPYQSSALRFRRATTFSKETARTRPRLRCRQLVCSSPFRFCSRTPLRSRPGA